MRRIILLTLAVLAMSAAPASAQEINTTDYLDAPEGEAQAQQAPLACTNSARMVKTSSGFFGYGNTTCPFLVTISAVPRIHRLFSTVAQGTWCLAAGFCGPTVLSPPLGASPGRYWLSYTVQEIAPPGWTFRVGGGAPYCTGYGSNRLFCNFGTPTQAWP